jgi:hypothetical protein
VGSLGRHPAASAFQAGLRPTKPRPETATRAGRRCQSAPCSGYGQSLRPLMRAMSGTRRRKFQDQSGPLEMNPWTKVGPPKIFIGPKVVDTGQGIASCPYAAALTWRMQLWGETAMKWSQAICASILVDEFYLLSLNARSNPRSGRDVPRLPAEPAFRPNLFTADWGLPPNPARTRPPKPQADAS